MYKHIVSTTRNDRWFVLTILLILAGACSSVDTGAVSGPGVSMFPTKKELLSSQDENWKLHRLLAETFFPEERLSGQTELPNGYNLVVASLYDVLKANPLFNETLSNLQHAGFAQLSVEDREKHIFEIINQNTSGMDGQRVRRLRLTYLAALYGSPLGYHLASYPSVSTVHPNPSEHLKHYGIQFPSGFARYDVVHRKVTAKEKPFDVAIVGSGPAGSVIANELNREGLTVVLIDQGPLAPPGLMNTRKFVDLHESRGQRTSRDGAILFRNGATVGGGATINNDLAFAPTLSMVRAQIEDWRKAGLIEARSFLPDEISSAYSYVSKKIGTRHLSLVEINANNSVLFEGSIKSGRQPSLYDLNTYVPGSSPSSVDDKGSPVDIFIRPALENKRNPLVILEETSVELLETKGLGRVHSLRLRKKVPSRLFGLIHDPHHLSIPDEEVFSVEAKQVILSAGTLGSASLLLRSGIKNNQIGKGIVAHISMPIIGIFDREIRAWEGLDASVYDGSSAPAKGYFLESMSADPAYVAMMCQGLVRRFLMR